jgi:hypothetical protein
MSIYIQKQNQIIETNSCNHRYNFLFLTSNQKDRLQSSTRMTDALEEV